MVRSEPLYGPSSRRWPGTPSPYRWFDDANAPALSRPAESETSSARLMRFAERETDVERRGHRVGEIEIELPEDGRQFSGRVEVVAAEHRRGHRWSRIEFGDIHASSHKVGQGRRLVRFHFENDLRQTRRPTPIRWIAREDKLDARSDLRHDVRTAGNEVRGIRTGERRCPSVTLGDVRGNEIREQCLPVRVRRPEDDRHRVVLGRANRADRLVSGEGERCRKQRPFGNGLVPVVNEVGGRNWNPVGPARPFRQRVLHHLRLDADELGCGDEPRAGFDAIPRGNDERLRPDLLHHHLGDGVRSRWRRRVEFRRQVRHRDGHDAAALKGDRAVRRTRRSGAAPRCTARDAPARGESENEKSCSCGRL